MTLWHIFQTHIFLCAFYLVYIGLAHKNSNFLFNRIYLLAAPALALIIPFIRIDGLSQELPVFQLQTIQLLSETSLTQPAWTFTDWHSLVAGLYFVGVATLLIVTLRKLLVIRRLLSGEHLATIGKVNVYRSTHPDSFSFFRRILLSDRQLDHADLIIRHELAHCQQLHSIDLIITSLYKIVFWFNPISYLWEKRVRENHEFMADRAVMNENTPFQEYANAILSVHFNSSFPHFGSGFNAPSLLRKRIQNMKHQNNSIMKHLVLLPALGCLLVATASMSQGDLSPAPPPPPPPPPTASNPVPAPLPAANDEAVVKPEFPGGMDALITYMNDNLVYPESLKKSNAKGKVLVSFMVKRDGTLENVSIKKESGYAEFDAEALRVIKKMPKWKPGTKDGKAVDAEMMLPVAFTM